jgi:hypothetical protein
MKSEDKAAGEAKICSGHFGKQLEAVRKDGRPSSCGFEIYCTLAHTSIVGKSKEKLTEKASGMPPPMKQDLIRSIQERK